MAESIMGAASPHPPAVAGGPQPDDERVKFLGLAFAGADIAFDIDGAGRIVVATGAVEQIAGLGPAGIVGADWTSLVSDDDAPLLGSLLANLQIGERQGPLRVSLRSRKEGGLTRIASLSVFRIPQNPEGMACALSVGAPAQLGDLPLNVCGLLDRAVFNDALASAIAQAHADGRELKVGLVQLQGLKAMLAQFDPGSLEAARRGIAAALRLASSGGMGAVEIASEKYAIILPSVAPSDGLAARLKDLCGPKVTPITADLRVSGVPVQSLRTLQNALIRYAEADAAAAASDFAAMVQRTALSTARLQSTLAAGAFQLFYQPVIDLEHNVAHHYEALSRFEGAESPYPTIRLAEEVGGIVELDLKVVQKVLEALASYPKSCRIAVNISAISLMTPLCVDAILAKIATHGVHRSRLLFEITESHKLGDLDQASRVIAKIRKSGHTVCLDDFEANGPSLDSLCRLEVDFVKIDGRYLRTLDTRSRDAVIVKHVLSLCAAFGVATIAEMVETREAAAVARSLGVGLAQGWLYGKPTPRPEWSAEAAASLPAHRIARVLSG
jgi:EAL domain-containing protein (putative c-di-GMP-specific phosphodiesterase class I)